MVLQPLEGLFRGSDPQSAVDDLAAPGDQFHRCVGLRALPRRALIRCIRKPPCDISAGWALRPFHEVMASPVHRTGVERPKGALEARPAFDEPFADRRRDDAGRRARDPWKTRKSGRGDVVRRPSLAQIFVDPTMAAQPLCEASPAARLARREKRADPRLDADRLDEKPGTTARQAVGVDVVERAAQIIVGDDDSGDGRRCRLRLADVATQCDPRPDATNRVGDHFYRRCVDIADRNNLDLRLTEAPNPFRLGAERFPAPL